MFNAIPEGGREANHHIMTSVAFMHGMSQIVHGCRKMNNHSVRRVKDI